MTIRRGRCNNVELCTLATAQKVIELPAEEPFICPNCSADLVALATPAAATGGRRMLALQVAVIVLGAGGIGYKLLTSATSKPAPPVTVASATPAAAASDTAPAAEAPAPAETAAPPSPPALAPAAPAVVQAVAVAPAAAPPPQTILLRLAGSDVITARLARRLAAGYLALIGDTDITTQPGPAPGTIYVVGMQTGQREAIAITQSSSSLGFNALLRGQADIALTVRPVATSEIESLAALGDMTSADAEHVAGVDAVVAIVNPAIRIGALTRAQLAGIFAGRIHNWSELGAAPGEIHPYARDGRDGQVDTASSLVFPDPSQARAAHAESDDDAVAAAVAHDGGGIGLVDMTAAASNRVLAIGDAAAPLAPTDVTVATEDYPLTRRLYLYSATAPGTGGGNFARRFTDYVASAGGQAAVEAGGFVSLSVKTQQAAAPQDASQRFRTLTAGATRLSTTFRFQPGSNLLDSRALRDIDRLAGFLRSRHSSGDQLILAGFADNTGSPAANDAVAQKRVAAVTAALSRAGLTPGRAESFGADIPVADNASADGREKNRRVEAYLAP